MKYLDWSKSNIQVDSILLEKIKFLLRLKFYSRRSLENLFARKDSEDKGSGRRGVVNQYTGEFKGHLEALERIQGHQDQCSSDQRACGIYGRLARSIWDLSILMGCRCMRISLWWLFCDGIICGPVYAVDVSPLYEDPVEVRSVDRPCALEMYNATRRFTHESTTCVIRRWAFPILGCIDLLSCIRSSLHENPVEVRYGSTLCTWYV